MADFDQVDLQIIRLLEENSRLKWKEIGDIVHLTGQAVAARIQKLEDSLRDIMESHGATRIACH